MPPKKQSANKKQLEKEKQKVIEDKTFGLKNKNKSAKVQKYIATVKKTVDESMKKKLPKPPSTADPKQRKTKAEIEAEKKAELAQLFKITQARVPAGADPKSVLCEFFKQGMCSKGDKCKFSHDLNVARRGAKIDVYTDQRDVKDATDSERKDDMESGNWTQEQLEKVVKEREDKAGRRVQSDIICKYFLDAVEARKYGWFWVCPNGGDKCQYRHALPPGYVLNSEKKKIEEDEPEVVPIEEVIEEERKKLTTRTALTKEVFLKWKEDREKRKQAVREEEDRQRREAVKAGKTQMSGREMFTFHPEFFVDDDEAMGADDYVHRATEGEEEVPETVLTVTGTSIVATQKGGGAPLQPIHITESLFVDTPLPEDDEEDGDENGENADEKEEKEPNGHDDGNSDEEEEEAEDDGEDEDEDEADAEQNGGAADDDVPEKSEKPDRPR